MSPVQGRKRPLLTVLGTINWDTTAFVSGLARAGEEVTVLRLEEAPGGKGANAAVAAARLLGPGSVAIVGAVGDDPRGSVLVDGVRAEGVGVRGVAVVKKQDSGRALIVVDSQGRKAIHTSFGANEKLSRGWLESSGVRNSLSGSKTVVIMDVPLEAAAVVAQLAKRGGARVVYSPCIRSRLGLSSIREALAFADSLVLDRSELRELCRNSSLKGSLGTIRKEFPLLTTVVTLGASGSVVVEGGRPTRLPGVSLGSLGLRPLNATGAGDAFLAAYSVYTMEGLTPREAARRANIAGALKATRPGSRGSPSRSELEALVGGTPTLRLRRQG